MAQHISAFTIVVPDYDAGLDFYAGTMGFTLCEDIDMGGGKRWVTVQPPGAAETRILLAQARGAAQKAAIGNQTGGRVGFFLHTGAFDRDHAALLARGVQFEEAPRTEPYGKVAVFRDPWGNRWDLLQLAHTA
ncbi:MAG: VOC family protein [Rhodobacteraceae bacterium]|nr:MAG: VOC family protein [Paracoccaceae bacterium]